MLVIAITIQFRRFTSDDADERIPIKLAWLEVRWKVGFCQHSRQLSEYSS